METLLKEGCWKILALFYNEKSAKIHLRGIAKKLNLNENSASIFLKRLEKEKLLVSKRQGNLKMYGIAKNDITYSIFAHFDVLKLNKLPSIRKNAIFYFLHALKEKPVIAILFGSTSKETYRENSDVDLLLVVNKKINTREAEKYADSQTAISVRPIQIGLSEFLDELKLKNDKVIQSAINTGYPVTNHMEYYRAVYHEGI